jgi:hypothetical protein
MLNSPNANWGDHSILFLLFHPSVMPPSTLRQARMVNSRVILYLSRIPSKLVSATLRQIKMVPKHRVTLPPRVKLARSFDRKSNKPRDEKTAGATRKEIVKQSRAHSMGGASTSRNMETCGRLDFAWLPSSGSRRCQIARTEAAASSNGSCRPLELHRDRVCASR